MVSRRATSLVCALALVAALAACSHKAVNGAGGLSAVGATPSQGGPASLPPSSTASPAATPSPAAASTAKSTTTPKAGHTTAKSTPTTAHPSPSAKTSSAPAEPVDFGFSWSNAYCTWIVRSDGSASVSMRGYIAVAGAIKTGSVTARITDDGGTLRTSEKYSAHLLPADSTVILSLAFDQTASELKGTTVTYTGTLVFEGVTDGLDADNSASLKVTFPATFMPGNQGDENLGCSHV